MRTDFENPKAETLAECCHAAVLVEQARCVAIVQAARFGEIDSDFRSIIHRIESGYVHTPDNP